MYNDNRIQLNASLKFNPAGELMSRDLLINFREQNVEDCCKLLSDFTRKFNLNLGLSQLPTAQPTKVPVAVAMATKEQDNNNPGNCPRCGAGLILRTAKKGLHAGSQFYSCSAFYSRGCLHTQPA